KRHLMGRQIKDHGLKDGELTVTDDAIRGIIRNYTREAGVRSLERELAGAFAEATDNLGGITSADLGQVTEPMGWMQVDMLRLTLHDRIMEELMPMLGEELGVPAGFNALDGD
ncbi:MAG: hypothetical protein VX228_09635, partial [Pseudomonadota bacterium]|nr:hypothetical protein [Pseudomonadota bacterium]